MMKSLLLCLFALLLSFSSFAQGTGPWNRPLKMATSVDGITFTPSTIFQDSSGVPSVIQWKGDTLICAFQWFRQPNPSPSWDRVAVKFSYNNGLTWTEPTPIVINGVAPGSQRPFDPTLVKFRVGDSLRIYYSSSLTPPMGGLDSTVNTYSAKSADGINYSFEAGERVDISNRPVIDPAVIYFNNMWHYQAPIGAPQDGAYHYTSNNGLNFNAVANVPSDATHNWTGNFVVVSSSELRFYGAGGTIWYNSSPNGGTWNGYVNTNITQGGDPSVVKLSNGTYLIIYVGAPYAPTTLQTVEKESLKLYPNPSQNLLQIEAADFQNCSYSIYALDGRIVKEGQLLDKQLDVSNLNAGHYVLELNIPDKAPIRSRFVKY